MVSTYTVNVRQSPNGTKIGLQFKGAVGMKSEESAILSGQYNWVYVNFDAGIDGYVATDFIAPVATTNVTYTISSETQAKIDSLKKQLLELQLLLLKLLRAKL